MIGERQQQFVKEENSSMISEKQHQFEKGGILCC